MSDDGSDDSLFHTDVSPIKDDGGIQNGGQPDRVGTSFYAFYETDEEKACEDVQRMAATLAPQVAELEDILKDMIPVGQNVDGVDRQHGGLSFLNDGNDDEIDEWDDEMHDELRQLANSEQLLRQELEFASNFSSLMASPVSTPPSAHNNSALDPPSVRPDAPEMTPRRILMPEISHKEDPPERFPSNAVTLATTTPVRYIWSPTPHKPPRTPGGTFYTLEDHAKHLKLRTERVGGWYYCDITNYVMGPDYNNSYDYYGGENVESEDPSFSSIRSPQQYPYQQYQNHEMQRYGNTPNYRNDLVKDYCIPLPIKKLKRLYCGLVPLNGGPIIAASSTGELAPPATPPQTPTGESTSSEYNTGTSATRMSTSETPKTPMATFTPGTTTPRQPKRPLHVEEPLPARTMAIRIRPDVLCGAVMDAINNALEGLSSSSSETIFGLETSNSQSPRTLSTHIVMKRQGGHFRGAVAVELADIPDATPAGTRRRSSNEKGKATLGYVVDAQLCTMKSDELERTLLIRFYHIQDDLEAQAELSAQWHSIKQQQKEEQQRKDEMTTASETTSTSEEATLMSPTTDGLDIPLSGAMNDESLDANRHLKQSCSLILQIMAAQSQGGGAHGNSNWVGFKDRAFASREALQDAIGKHLETSFRPCPSVREGNKKLSNSQYVQRLTMPTLSNGDWPLIKESWKLCCSIFEELENRDCTYNTLSTLRFGQFPSLTTLDVQYCSQLRRLSRESMISQLLASAKELENYAKSAEYNCANVLTLLEPRVSYYGIPVLDLPQPKPLENYPLDFTPPQVVCPPWGVKVMEALNQVSASTTMMNQAMAASSPLNMLGSPDALSHFVPPDSQTPVSTESTGLPSLQTQESLPPPMEATEAVKMVYTAFTRHDDEEYGARLGRKNTQVMERLANMQSHQRAVLHSIRDAHNTSRPAARAADNFLIKSQLASNVGQPGFPLLIQQQVPVFSIRISIGTSVSGDCTVTANHILFQTSYLPLVGRTTTTLFDLGQVDFQAHENVASSVLNPFPDTVSVLAGGQVVYGFRPKSLGASRLCNFLNVLKGYQSEAAAGRGAHSEFHQPEELLDDDDDGAEDGDGQDGASAQHNDLAETVSDDGQLPI